MAWRLQALHPHAIDAASNGSEHGVVPGAVRRHDRHAGRRQQFQERLLGAKHEVLADAVGPDPVLALRADLIPPNDNAPPKESMLAHIAASASMAAWRS